MSSLQHKNVGAVTNIPLGITPHPSVAVLLAQVYSVLKESSDERYYSGVGSVHFLHLSVRINYASKFPECLHTEETMHGLFSSHKSQFSMPFFPHLG